MGRQISDFVSDTNKQTQSKNRKMREKKLSRSKVITVKHVRNDNSFTVNLDKQMVIANCRLAMFRSLVCTALLNGTAHIIK